MFLLVFLYLKLIVVDHWVHIFLDDVLHALFVLPLLLDEKVLMGLDSF
jgi:hypothetical protein